MAKTRTRLLQMQQPARQLLDIQHMTADASERNGLITIHSAAGLPARHPLSELAPSLQIASGGPSGNAGISSKETLVIRHTVPPKAHASSGSPALGVPCRLCVPLLLALLLVGLSFPRALAQSPNVRTTSSDRPRIGLVLSGGGARGAAHIGVLKVLEELRIPVDFVVGTSMGSIVGGFYAAGMGPGDIEDAVHAIDWSSAFEDVPPRSERSYRRKQDDQKSLIRYRLHMSRGSIRLPMGVIPAQKLTNILKFYEVRMAAPSDFDLLPIPYRAVAADVNTGETVVLDHGSLATAMRASMSIPGAFPPVEIDGRLLVDGGVAANLPVEPAVERPVDRIIAIDISTPVESKEDPESYLGVVQRLTGFLTRGSVFRQLALLEEDDIFIAPELGEMSAASFDRLDEAIAIGEEAARAASASLTRLSVDEARYAQWRRSQRREPRPTPIIDDIRVENESSLGDEVIKAHISQQTGERLEPYQVLDDLSYLFGLDIFEPITADLQWQSEDRADLIVRPKKSRIGTNILQIGLALEDDFEGGNSYQLSARYQRLAVNRRGAEWRTDLDVGFLSGLRTEFYQPVDARLRYFVQPSVALERERLDLVLDGERILQFGVTAWGGALDVGRNLGRWGQLTLGFQRGRAEAEISIGPPLIDTQTIDVSEGRARLEVDTYDQVSWPSRGTFIEGELNAGSTILGGETKTTRVEAFAEHAFSFGRTTLLPGAELGYALNGAQVGEGMILGGIFRLSGYRPYELFDARGFLLRLRLYRRLNPRSGNVLAPGWYVGGSLEGGEVYGAGEKMRLDAMRWGGSVFLGADTVIGPVFLGLGLAEEGRRRVYFAIGKNFTGTRAP